MTSGMVLSARRATLPAWATGGGLAAAYRGKYSRCRVTFNDATGYHTYELNLVLSGMPLRRLGLGSHADKAAGDADAVRLAQFLECAVLDDCAWTGQFRHEPYDAREADPFSMADN